MQAALARGRPAARARAGDPQPDPLRDAAGGQAGPQAASCRPAPGAPRVRGTSAGRRMSRALWFVAGTGAGVYAAVRAKRVAEALSVDGLRDRVERRRRGRADLPRRGGPGPGRGRNRVARADGRRAPWGRAAPRPRGRRAASTRRKRAAPDGDQRDPPPLPRALRARGAHRGALGVPAARRPEPAVRQRRHGAVQAVLPRPGDAAVPPRHQRAEVRAHPRHRGRRQDHPARHVLRDVRQLLLRRLLQGGRHRARLGPGHQVPGRRRLGARGEPAVALDPARATTRRWRCG